MSVLDPVDDCFDIIIALIKTVTGFDSRVYKTDNEMDGLLKYPCCIVTPLTRIAKAPAGFTFEIWTMPFGMEIKQ